ncbi:MAG TPA: iron ABC transporter substrate-binding protein [Gaiellaceae bacterium]|jgi:iron(III) transport system substrate-binding protein|nr:iron ABC transporter substrate-binding protein [Gaiellaceae bacterium]
MEVSYVKKIVVLALVAVVGALALAAGASTAPTQTTSLTVYSGREERLVEPIMDRFTKETGIRLDVRYASSTSLATALVEEGRSSPADVYWSQEPGTLGLVGARGLLARLPQTTVGKVPSRFATPSRRWVGTSGRSRVLVYNTNELQPSELPASVWGLTNARWKGKIGIAPTNASFQAFLGATIHLYGESRVRAWLEGLQENDVRFYPNNTTVVQAVARGDVEVGLVNHYYLYNLLVDTPNLPVRNHWFRDGDPGNLVLAAGVGIVASTDKAAAATRFVNFLLSKTGQRMIARGPGAAEYPLVKGVPRRPGLPPLASIKGPKYNLGRLAADIAPAVRLLLEEGYIR